LRLVGADSQVGLAAGPSSHGVTEKGRRNRMRSIREDAPRLEIADRVKGLTDANERRWGRMELNQALAHLGDQIRMALGLVPVKGASGPFRFAPMRFAVIHVLPWPKGKARAPDEAFTTRPSGLDADKAALLELIEQFAAADPDTLSPIHPLFGRMTLRDWDVLTYRHLDHHLRQFGAQ
jgi:hypothetical protein